LLGNAEVFPGNAPRLSRLGFQCRQPLLVYQRDYVSGKTADQLEQQDEGVPEV